MDAGKVGGLSRQKLMAYVVDAESWKGLRKRDLPMTNIRYMPLESGRFSIITGDDTFTCPITMLVLNTGSAQDSYVNSRALFTKSTNLGAVRGMRPGAKTIDGPVRQFLGENTSSFNKFHLIIN